MENYILYDEVGRGEHSVVYKGRKKGTIEFVAIHCVEKCKRLELRNIVRLTHEMDHPNVVRFHEWYETTNHIWMVVELCTGDSLDAVLTQDKNLPEETVRCFGVEIAKALFYIHSLDILYCDLKPSRIMLDGAGVLKLSDFALARVEGEDDFYDNLLQEQNSDGDDEDQNYKGKERELGKRPKPSPHYMAPEVLNGGPHSKEADLWSFGCVLYEMFTGEQPFVADSFPELVSKIFNDDSPHLRSKTDAVTSDRLQELDNLIQGLLEKDPQQRLSWRDLIVHKFWNGELEHQLKSGEGNGEAAANEGQNESQPKESHEHLPSGLVNEDKEKVISNNDLLNLPDQMVRQGTYTFSSRPHTADSLSSNGEHKSLGKTHTVVKRTKSDDQFKSTSNSNKTSKQAVNNSNVAAANPKNNKSTPLKQNQTFNKRDFTGLKQNGPAQSEVQESNCYLVLEVQQDENSGNQKSISNLANHPSDFIVTPIADNPKIKKFALPKWDSKALPCQPLKTGELVDLPEDKFEEHLSAIRGLLCQRDKSTTGPIAALHRSKLHTSSYLASLCRDGEIANVIFDSDFISAVLSQIKSGFSADFKARLGKCITVKLVLLFGTVFCWLDLAKFHLFVFKTSPWGTARQLCRVDSESLSCRFPSFREFSVLLIKYNRGSCLLLSF